MLEKEQISCGGNDNEHMTTKGNVKEQADYGDAEEDREETNWSCDVTDGEEAKTTLQ